MREDNPGKYFPFRKCVSSLPDNAFSFSDGYFRIPVGNFYDAGRVDFGGISTSNSAPQNGQYLITEEKLKNFPGGQLSLSPSTFLQRGHLMPKTSAILNIIKSAKNIATLTNGGSALLTHIFKSKATSPSQERNAPA